jgi:hypothetical protein
MDNKKILKGVGIFCILASLFSVGVSLGLGKGLSGAGFGALAVGLILVALSTPSKEK